MFCVIVYLILLIASGVLIKIIINHYEETREIIINDYLLETKFKTIIDLLLVVIISASLILFDNFCCK